MAALDDLLIDGLTGLGRREALDAALDEVDRTSSAENPAAILMLDLDHFKAINDTYGHAAGDEVLRGVGEAIREVLGASTRLCGAGEPAGRGYRFGGEEFVVVLPSCRAGRGAALAGRLLDTLRALRFSIPGLQVTASAGLAVTPGPGGQRAEAAWREADRLLYRAKRAGRDRLFTMEE